MAPNKLMGPVEKTPDVSMEAIFIKPEKDNATDEETGPFPVLTCDTQPDKDDAESDSEDQGNSTRHLPIDRGWAWVVLAACILYLALIGGIRKNLGLFFVNFQNRFNSSAALTSSLSTTQSLVNSVGSLLVMTIGMQYMNSRVSIMIGSLLMTVSCLISAFATDIRVLYLSFGFLEGLGMALIHPPTTAALGEYFHKKRGFANGIAYSGASFGGLIFAPIITTLFDTYGYSGTMMMVAGMTLNMMITGALMRPMSFYDKKTRKSHKQVYEHDRDEEIVDCCGNENSIKINNAILKRVEQNGIKHTVECDVDDNNIKRNCEISKDVGLNGDITRHVARDETIQSVPNDEHKLHLKTAKDKFSSRLIVRSDSHDPSQIRNKSGATSPLLLRQRVWSVGSRQRTVSETSKLAKPMNHIVESLSRSRVALYSSSEVVFGSIVDIKEVTFKGYAHSDVESRETSVCSRIKHSLVQSLSVLFDKSLLKNHVFQLFLLMAFMLASSNVFLCVTMAPHAKDLGVSSNDIGLLLSVLSGCGTTSRILVAFFSDRKFIKLTTILGCVAMFVGIFANFVRFFQSYTSLIIFAGILGFCCEIYQAMFAVILVEYLTLAKLKSCIGFTLLIHGASLATIFQLVGIMRDATGSYFIPYHFLGTMAIIGAVCALSLPLVHKRYNVNRTDVSDV